MRQRAVARSLPALAALLALAALAALVGCAESDDHPPPPSRETVMALDAVPAPDTASATAAPSATAAAPGSTAVTSEAPVLDVSRCAEGTSRECKRRLPSHRQQAECLVGLELCVDGAFGPCRSLEEVSATLE